MSILLFSSKSIHNQFGPTYKGKDHDKHNSTKRQEEKFQEHLRQIFRRSHFVLGYRRHDEAAACGKRADAGYRCGPDHANKHIDKA